MCVQFTFHHQFGIGTWRSKFEQQTGQCSFCLWISWTRITRILIRSTLVHRVMHNTCIKHGRVIRTQYIGSTSFLLWRKDQSSFRLDRARSFFKKHFQLIVVRRLSGWKLEKSCTRKFLRHFGRHQRSPWNTPAKRELGSEHAQRPEVGQLSRSFQSNQPIPIQVVKERWDPLLKMTREPCKMEETSHSQDVNSLTKNCSFGKNGETRCWTESDPNTFIWRQ